MSAASRSKVRARARHREQVARAIAEVEVPHDYPNPPGWNVAEHDNTTARWWRVRAQRYGLLHPDSRTMREAGACFFNVHAAGEHAGQLIATEAEQVECRTPDCDKGLVWRNMGPSPCPDCQGRGTWAYGELPDKLVRAPFMARLGRRILDMLDGERGRPESAWLHAPYQPSECQACDWATARDEYLRAIPGHGYVECLSPSGPGTPGDDFGADTSPDRPRVEIRLIRCPDCHGTGRNLRGSLPPVGWSPQLVCKVADSVRHAKSPGDGAEWTACLYRTEGQAFSRAVEHMPGPREPARSGTNRPRVVPRGEERFALVDRRARAELRDQRRGADLTASVLRARARDLVADRAFDLLPAHERGRIRHAEQRRRKG